MGIAKFSIARSDFEKKPSKPTKPAKAAEPMWIEVGIGKTTAKQTPN